jgi:hypothetical protein
MFWIHPYWQAAAILLSGYVFILGWARFAVVNLGRQGIFLWKRHVFLGKMALYLLMYGASVGAAAAWVKWRTVGMTGSHFRVGIAIMLLALFGYWSGLRMDIHKKQRRVLPLLHGVNNLLLLALTLLSLVTGATVILTRLP